MTHSTEVHFKVPLLEDLYCINCRVEHSGSILNSIVKSLFHVQVLYCRLIIYSIRCCIASPSIQNVGDVVHVIVSKKFFATGKLQSHLSDLKIKYSDPEPVHSKVYEACLKYTITFKLAPLWNCMGKSWYLYGDNFLSLPYNNDAIEWEIYYKGEETRLGLKPMKVNLFPFALENVYPALWLENFKKSSTLYINLGFESPQVYVLPKLTKGRVVSVSKILPKSCPFENYDILRRHWKNMYSYRLPKTAEGMLFYEVVFSMNPNQKFTYPEMCLLSRRPEFLASDNKNAVASRFLKDLAESIQSICNEPIKIGHLYPELPIERSGQPVRDINHPIFPYRDIDTICTSFSKTPLDEYVLKPPEKKLKMSNLFTFKGIDKMTPHMRDHSQKVLSIMNGQSKNSKTSSSSQYKSGTSSSYSEEKFANGNGRKLSLGNLSTSSKRRTEISDTDKICSFYEIPSMYPSRNDSFTKYSSRDAADVDKNCSKEPKSQATNASAFTFSEPSYPTEKAKPKPTIKNIETVNFDLNGIRKIRTVHEVYKGNTEFDESKNTKSKKTKDNEVTSRFFDQEKDGKQASLPNSSNNVQKENYRDENYHKMDVDKQFKKSEHVNDALKENREPSDKEDLRSVFSKFDSYNIGEEEDQHFENNIYTECNNTPFAFERGKGAEEKLAYQKFNNQSSDNPPSPLSLSPIQTSPSLLQKYHSPEVSPKQPHQSFDETQFLEPTMPVTMENQTNTYCPSPSPFEANACDKNKVQHESQNRSLFCNDQPKENRKRESFFNFSKREESVLDQSISSNYTFEMCGDTLVRKYTQSKKASISQSSQVTVKNPQGPSETNFSDEDESSYSPSMLDMCKQPTQKLRQKPSQQVSFQETRGEQPLTNCASEARNDFEFFKKPSLNQTLDTREGFEIDGEPTPNFQFEGVKEDDKVFKLDDLGPNNPACDNSDFFSIISQSTDSEPESSVYEHLQREYDEALTYYD